MTLRIREVADLDIGSRDRVGPHPAGPAEHFGLLERLLDVGHADVEGDVTVVALHAAADPSRDPDSVARRVALDERVVHSGDRGARVEVPPEELAVIPLELL